MMHSKNVDMSKMIRRLQNVLENMFYLHSLRFHGFQCDGLCQVHVRLHVLVVHRHDLDEALEGRHLDLNVGGLRRFADHLHDEVTLRLGKKTLLWGGWKNLNIESLIAALEKENVTNLWEVSGILCTKSTFTSHGINWHVNNEQQVG